MGKMFESLLKRNGQHGSPAENPPIPCVETPAAEPVDAVAETVEEYPYIEVGAPGKKIDASPVVLAAVPARPALCKKETVAPVPQTLVPTLAEPRPVGVTLEVLPTPAPAKKIAREIIAFHQPDHAIAKQYGELFTRMIEDLDGESRVVVLAGSAPQTGTTTVVLNLAFSGCGSTKGPVAVVEGNVLRPALAQRLGIDKTPGLLDVLAGTVALEKSIVPTLQPHLHVLRAGNQKALARHVTPEAVRWVLGWLRERYEVVLVDGPDLSEPHEVETWAAVGDALYLVVPRPETSPSVAQSLTRRGIRVRGLIHTHFETL